MAKPLLIENNVGPEPDRDAVYVDSANEYWWYVDGEGWDWGTLQAGCLISQSRFYRTWGSSSERVTDFPWTLVGTQKSGIVVARATDPGFFAQESKEGAALKDSGARTQYAGGGVRDSSEGKPRFDLLWPEHVPYQDQFLTQVASVMEMGARKYAERNWELFHTQEALDHAKASLGRHYANYMSGATDEPHLALMACNLLFLATIQWKLDNGWTPS